MKSEADLAELVLTYRRLSTVLGEIQQAVMAADTDRLSELVPQQEELMRQASEVPLPEKVPKEIASELQRLATEAVGRNTTNAVLLSEQLSLIEETMKAIFGKQRAIDRLA